MDRRKFLTSLSGAALAAPLAAAGRRPNIVFILADDLGYGDLGCYGQRTIQTPFLDRMAAEGVRFTQAYAGSTVCAPSRCCIETGRHTGHAFIRGNGPIPPFEERGVGEVMRDAGYRTALLGKWSLGGLGTVGYPMDKGYEKWFGFFSQGHAHNYYPEHLLDGRTARLLRGNLGAEKTEYAPDLFTDRALGFIDEGGERPFFLHLAYTTPHTNNELGRDTGDGQEVPNYGRYVNEDWPSPEKGFAAMISRMDADIGRIFDKLKQTGQDENTLVVFASDNGPHEEGGHKHEFFNSNGPLRGYKRDLYDGGIRVPAMARWPGKIEPGRTSDHIWAFWDLVPTFADVAGASVPSGLDGISFLPELLGQPQSAHDHLYWEFHRPHFRQAVRQERWKGVRWSRKHPIELYDMEEALDEQHDVADQHPNVVRRLERIMNESHTDSPHWPIKDPEG